MSAAQRPICFVVMPFGIKRSRSSSEHYDFDRIWEDGIKPAMHKAGAEPLRCDVDLSVDFMHRAIFERIAQSDIVVADLTTGSPTVLYELGIRHALRPRGTIAITASLGAIPFDLALIRTVRYRLVAGALTAETAQEFQRELAAVLRNTIARGGADDSPVFRLLGNPIPLTAGAAERQPLVFLSYAREDTTNAGRVYDALIGQHVRAWMDTRSILPGEDWQLAIDTAIRRADFIFVLLSERSASKRGYLRKEILLALERAKEMLPTDIFIVPVRLDECAVPRELSAHQWVDLFSGDGLAQLVAAIREGMKRRAG